MPDGNDKNNNVIGLDGSTHFFVDKIKEILALLNNGNEDHDVNIANENQRLALEMRSFRENSVLNHDSFTNIREVDRLINRNALFEAILEHFYIALCRLDLFEYNQSAGLSYNVSMFMLTPRHIDFLRYVIRRLLPHHFISSDNNNPSIRSLEEICYMVELQDSEINSDGSIAVSSWSSSMDSEEHTANEHVLINEHLLTMRRNFNNEFAQNLPSSTVGIQHNFADRIQISSIDEVFEPGFFFDVPFFRAFYHNINANSGLAINSF